MWVGAWVPYEVGRICTVVGVGSVWDGVLYRVGFRISWGPLQGRVPYKVGCVQVGSLLSD